MDDVGHDLAMVLSWLRMLRDEFSWSALQGGVEALAFMERAGGIADSEKLSTHSAVASLLKEAALTCKQGTRARNKAPPTPLVFLLMFERTVMSTSSPSFIRMLAWFKLVKFWCTLRSDDHRGLIPSRIRVLQSGMRGTLVRTKTSGKGKSREELELVIDRAAYLFEPSWLHTGWALWEKVGSGRDYFMGLPTPDLEGTRQVEAKCSHAVALDRALLSHMKLASGSEWLQHSVACELWTLHSDRASLPSLAACLSEVPPEWIEDFGRWSKGMSATHVRTHLARIRSIQRWVAEAARQNARLDEEELWSDFAVFLMRHGLSTDDTVEQIVSLAKVPSSARAAYRAQSVGPAFGDVAPDVPPTLEEACGQEPVEEPAPLTPSHTAPDDCPGMGMFVVSLRRGFRRLHRVGDCHLEPGVDYKDFRTLGADRPSHEHYDAACRWCFKSDQFEDVEISSSSAGSSS